MSTWIVVDDADPAIVYDTPDQWSAVTQSLPGTVDLDNAVFQTGHVLSSNASLSLAFNGTQIDVFGVASKLNLSATDHKHDPTWTCALDNIPIAVNASALRGFPWTSYCSVAGLNDSPHVLTVNVTATAQRQFWLDYIRYVPLPGAAASQSQSQNATLLVNSTDPAVHLPASAGWKGIGTAQFTETQPGMDPVSAQAISMSYAFNGTGIVWYGLALQAIIQTDNTIMGAFPAKQGTAIVTMDGGPRNVSIPTTNPQSDPSSDQVLFSYEALDPTKEHTLTATYVPDPAGQRTPPLTLDFLLVQTGPAGTSGTTGGGSGAPAPSSTETPQDGSHAAQKGGKSVHAGAIVGGVLGALLFVLLALLLVRWRRTQAQAARRARAHPAKSIAFVHDEPRFADADTDDVESDSEAFALRTAAYSVRDSGTTASTAAPVLGQGRAGAGTGSRFVEDAANEPMLVSTGTAAPEWAYKTTPPRQAYSSVSSRAPSMLVDYSPPLPPPPPPRTGSQTPSVNTVTNPFRKLSLASASPEASFVSTPERTRSPSNSNPFRGGPMRSASSQRGT